MIGATAIARTPLAPTGQVEIDGELWQASLRGQPSVDPGTAVLVRGVDGLVLIVEPAKASI
jgi:membrane-bound serine protease (ClpP class)